MQEVWDLFQLEEIHASTEDVHDSPVEQSEQLFLALSSYALRGARGRQTIQLHGEVQGHPVTVLIDSGSSASFLAASIAEQLPQLQRTPLTASVKVANGHLIECTEAVMGYCFSLWEYQFQQDLHILSLESYDLILGMDWLELYSPMEVHWQAKWLSIPYKGDTIVLQGLTAVSDTEFVVQLLAVDT